ncbi:hypothetical protein [Halostagnicola kamekurae]|uniref:hypothetical protein n=1 Tax=Halostagnicola kamekurae TaxID=619731 RepID=UPI0011137E45|nr:hypothetical protein [Halostagnicola kamekurae]
MNTGGWPSMLYGLFLDRGFDRDEQDYELDRENGLCLDGWAVKQHFANNIEGQKPGEIFEYC